MKKPSSLPQLQKKIDAAMGRIPCDVIFKNARYLDVFSCQWRTGDLSVFDQTIVSLSSGLTAKRIVDLKGKTIVPGWIDAHVHVESSMMIPLNFQKMVLPRGTTTAICDPHEIANVLGVPGIEYFLNQSSELTLDLRVMLSSCVPATHLETNGGGEISAADLAPLAHHPRALGLAEIMNVPGVLNADSKLLSKISEFSDRPLDGHCPLLSGRELSAYAAAGISSCHESSQLPEAQEKLAHGISIWIREGSVAKDLHALLPLIHMQTSTSLGFCTDDRNPLDIAQQGHLDYLLRESIQSGVPAEIVFRCASWSVARHYGLDRGPHRVGAIAPGYRADLVILDDLKSCSIHQVWTHGKPTEELSLSSSLSSPPSALGATLRATPPEPHDLRGPQGAVHVIEIFPGKILTGHQVLDSLHPGVHSLSVLERHGHGLPPANGYVLGFGQNLRGAIASSVGHDSHNLIVVGSSHLDMREALAALISQGGGFAVVQNGNLLAHLALPWAGLMSDEAPSLLIQKLQKLREASRQIGCELEDPFLQLAFLSLPVIPKLKLTDRGLVDVDAFKIISVSA